jgi:uncharacterized protein (UPF0335 family)
VLVSQLASPEPQHIHGFDPDVGAAMEEVFNEHRGEGFDREMSKWFNHVIQFKGMDFGTGIGEPP